MKPIACLLLVPLSALALCGCGTVLNLASSEPTPYGGLQKDVQVLSHLKFNVGAGGPGSAVVALGILGVCGAELSATAVGDTVTLPFTRPGNSLLREDKDFLGGRVQYTTATPGTSACCGDGTSLLRPFVPPVAAEPAEDVSPHSKPEKEPLLFEEVEVKSVCSAPPMALPADQFEAGERLGEQLFRLPLQWRTSPGEGLEPGVAEGLLDLVKR